MTGYTYILRCSDGTFYAGSTRDLNTRLETHAQGMGSAYTECRLPVELVWFAEFSRIDEAFGLEKRIQGWSHAKRLAFIEGGFDAIKGWSARERKIRAVPKPQSPPDPVVERVERVETHCTDYVSRAFRLVAALLAQ